MAVVSKEKLSGDRLFLELHPSPTLGRLVFVLSFFPTHPETSGTLSVGFFVSRVSFESECCRLEGLTCASTGLQEAALRGLLGALTSTPYSPTQHLEREQALAKQFAEILHFTLRFDELKMTNPAIQNDFSYYRRTLSRMRINNVPAEGENEVNNELANRMSLFYAEATPMLKTLSDATTKFVSEVSIA
ncbi:hypothetical protein P7K49_026398 [Saguinus oedipus]|uniref:CYRIA/CYRIB Rac1 binding domain-containing protein n=1 Tax=Saguinus oedipus TaxID=9490 RepID=A0ABQ9UD47_SAGOE|nr:hypothetical protein P7K49_026398 [Saguinus oedipus]